MTVSKNILWRVRLFDGPKLETPDGEEIVRFKSQKVAALLAYLALKLGRPCPREELYFALWPEEDNTRATSNRLSVALASLRRQMEPSGTPFGSVLDVSHPSCILLREETVWCDVIAIEQALKAGDQEEAAELLQGELLPGFYEDWAVIQQHRFTTIREEIQPTLPVEDTPRNQPNPRQTAFHADFLHSARRYSLPLYLTRFYGRDEELEQLLESFCEKRLVTIIGPGGMGKTRLAVEAANKMRAISVFVALADIESDASVSEAILQALRVLPDAHTDLFDQVITALDRQGMPLLILDNAEHVLESVAELTLRLLEVLPELQILVTSRQRLEIVGETLFSLSCLVCPTPDMPYEQLRKVPAIALFLDRARHVRPDFTLTIRQAPDIIKICELVEGVALALELAAARVTQQTPAQIAADLAGNLLCLKSRQRGLSKRHQSLRAMIQGSFDLMTPEQQAFFSDLSIFQGGWTGEAAASVMENANANQLLEELLSRSLIIVTEDIERGMIRYSFLETIRQFAREQLSDTQRKWVTKKHSEYFLQLAAEVWEDDIRKLPPLDAEIENLQIALEYGWEMQDELFWNGLIGALCYMFVRGQRRIAIPWAERALSKVSEISDAVIRTRLREVIIRHLQDLGRLDEARKIGRDMEKDGRERGDKATINLAAIRLSLIETETEDSENHIEMSVQVQREALRAARCLDDPLLLKIALSMTARCLIDFGVSSGTDTETGKNLLEESLALGLECYKMLSPHSRFITTVELSLAMCYANLDQEKEAYQTLKSCQHSALSQGVPSVLMSGFYFESLAALKAGQFTYAALLQGAVLNIHERINFNRFDYTAGIQSLQTELLKGLDEELFERLAQLGRRTPHKDLVNANLDNPPAILREIDILSAPIK